MNGLFKKVHLVLLALAVVSSQIHGLAARRKSMQVATPAVMKSSAPLVREVIKATDLAGQILEQAKIIVRGQKTERADAKKSLIMLFNNLKKLGKSNDSDKKLANTIHGDVMIISKMTDSAASKAEAEEAYERLEANIKEVKANAELIKTLARENRKLKTVSAENLPQAAAEADMNIKSAQEKAEAASKAGYASRAASGVKTLFYAPFDSERSAMERAFYATVGLAALGGGAYGIYQYGAPAVMAAYNMTADEWKALSGAAKAKLLATWEASTWANAKEKLGTWWDTATTGFGLFQSAKSAVTTLTTALATAQFALKAAEDFYYNNPQDPVAAADYIKAKQNVDAFTKQLDRAKLTVEERAKLEETASAEAQKLAEEAQLIEQQAEQQIILENLKKQKAAEQNPA